MLKIVLLVALAAIAAGCSGGEKKLYLLVDCQQHGTC